MTRGEVINAVICVLFSFHASLLSGVSLEQPWSVFFLIKFVIFFRQEILGFFLLLQIQLILQLFFQYCKVGRKKAWAIHDH